MVGTEVRNDLWNKNTCVVCQVKCAPSEREKHVLTSDHKKKTRVYDFFTKEASQFKASDKPSTIAKRYLRSRERALGIECIHELVLTSGARWWACSICYEAGVSIEDLDEHLMSLDHMRTYIEEFHPSRKITKKGSDDKVALMDELLHLRESILNENDIAPGEPQKPEVLDLTLNEEGARIALGPVTGTVLYDYHRLPSDSRRQVMRCEVCNVAVPALNATADRVWLAHTQQPFHKKCRFIKTYLKQFRVLMIQDSDSKPDSGPFDWHVEDGVYYGPVCGMKYLLTLGNENFCTLCMTPLDSIEKHFTSEHHIQCFVGTLAPADVYRASMMSDEKRRMTIVNLLQTRASPINNNSQCRSRDLTCLPDTIRKMCDEFHPSAPSIRPSITMLSDESCALFCTTCLLYIKVATTCTEEQLNEIWDAHIETPAHFEYGARRSAYYFDTELIVPISSTIELRNEEIKGEWKDVGSGEAKFSIQTQANVGLEYIYEDIDEGEVVCTLCGRMYKSAQQEHVNNHIRAYSHLTQYLHQTNREMLSLLLLQRGEKATHELLLEFLQRVKATATDEIRVYKPDLALKMATKWPKITMRTLDMAALSPDERVVRSCMNDIIDHISDDGHEHASMNSLYALTWSGILILETKEVERKKKDDPQRTILLCRCKHCHVTFVTSMEKFSEEIWGEGGHFASDLHKRRATEFESFKEDSYGYAEARSTYTVKSYPQKDPNKKVTWQWNSKAKVHEFVLSVVGLEDIVERRSTYQDGELEKPDFFCRLCALSIQRRSYNLEAHVRGPEHVFNYVNRYFPKTVLTYEELPKDDNGKELRKLVAQLLKEVKPISEYPIPVFDPIGEQERKAQIALDKAREEEKKKEMEEEKKRQAELRKKKEEEWKKQKEANDARLKAEKEKLEKMEREARERIAKEEAKRLERQKLLEAEYKQRDEYLRKLEEDRKVDARLTELERLRKARADADRLNQMLVTEREMHALKEKETQLLAIEQEKLRLEAEYQRVKRERELAAAATMSMPGQPQYAMPTMSAVLPAPGLVAPIVASALPQQQAVVYNPSLMSVPPPGYAPMVQTTVVSTPMMMPQTQYFVGGAAVGAPPSALPNMTVPPPTINIPPPPQLAPPPSIPPSMALGKSSYMPHAEPVPLYPAKRRSRSRSSSRSRSRSRSRGRSRTRTRSGEMAPRKPLDGERPSLMGVKPEIAISNPENFKTPKDAMDYMWPLGTDPIPKDEMPKKFNRKIASIAGVLGGETLYEVVCIDNHTLDTYYCSMCQAWLIPNEMFEHMMTEAHRVAHLFRNYKMAHRKVVMERDPSKRAESLRSFCEQIWKLEGSGQVTHRLRSVVNTSIVQRLWPDVHQKMDLTWKLEEVCQSPKPPEPEIQVVKEVKKSDKRRSPERRSRRSRSRSPNDRRDRDRKEKKRSRSRSRSRAKRSPSRERRRSPSRERNRKRSPKRDRKSSPSEDRKKRRRSPSPRKDERPKQSWEEQAAQFLAKIGDKDAARKVLQQQQQAPAPRVSRLDKGPEPLPPGISMMDMERRRLEEEERRRVAEFQADQARLEQEMRRRREFEEEQRRREEAERARRDQPEEKNREVRKLLAFMVEMNKQTQAGGKVDQAYIQSLCRDMGINIEDIQRNEQLLSQLVSGLGGASQSAPTQGGPPRLDLSAYGITKPQPGSLNLPQEPSRIPASMTASRGAPVGSGIVRDEQNMDISDDSDDDDSPHVYNPNPKSTAQATSLDPRYAGGPSGYPSSAQVAPAGYPGGPSGYPGGSGYPPTTQGDYPSSSLPAGYPGSNPGGPAGYPPTTAASMDPRRSAYDIRDPGMATSLPSWRNDPRGFDVGPQAAAMSAAAGYGGPRPNGAPMAEEEWRRRQVASAYYGQSGPPAAPAAGTYPSSRPEGAKSSLGDRLDQLMKQRAEHEARMRAAGSQPGAAAPSTARPTLSSEVLKDINIPKDLAASLQALKQKTAAATTTASTPTTTTPNSAAAYAAQAAAMMPPTQRNPGPESYRMPVVEPLPPMRPATQYTPGYGPFSYPNAPPGRVPAIPPQQQPAPQQQLPPTAGARQPWSGYPPFY